MTNSESTSSKKYPCVVIAGRPNVGKSTLFNRFLRKRRAITDPVPGVTRDPISAECDLGGRKILLTDTGGIDYSKEGFAQLITDKSLATLEKADLILLLLEGKEMNSADEHIIKQLRRYTDKLFLVINKLDSPEKDDDVWNYHSLGFRKVIGISSAHGRNIDTLVEEMRGFLDEKLPPSDEEEDEEPYQQEENARIKEIKLSIIGKPNTGKSTLLNRLFPDLSLSTSEISYKIQRGKRTSQKTNGRLHCRKRTYVSGNAGLKLRREKHESYRYEYN